MVMMTVIAVVGLAVLISLFYLYFNKIRKNVEKHLQLFFYTQNTVFSQNPSFFFIILLSVIFSAVFIY